ncbi:MAG: RNA methyltransferase [Methylococcales bacterium]|jgi:TrmH family RNA methyltransferase|nr:RNA methyltransferase [Methylococcales bacterium]MBT7410822.1 RNA methyltransferase [Methylococcales bacterium]
MNINIVLVEPSHPGNIGAVARAMKNMELSQLSLVKPKLFPHADATARASGADDILSKADIYQDLPSAIASAHVVFGASARSRRIQWPLLDVRECAEKIIEQVQLGQVAIVFGREHSGLTNDELSLCQYLLRIPCNPDFSSLNLAAAVQVVSYEILMSQTQQKPVTKETLDIEPAEIIKQEEMDSFFQHLKQTLTEIGYLNPKQPKKLMLRLKRLYNRAIQDKSELNMLRGILSATHKKCRLDKEIRNQ